ncbi:MAG: hypothetical protein ACTHNN_15605 [Xanthobacteraceae bacterium]
MMPLLLAAVHGLIFDGMPDHTGIPTLEPMEFRMPIALRSPLHVRAMLMLVAGLALAGCSSLQRNQPPEAAAAAQTDDDAACRANGVAPGSDAYVACRKDRDARRGVATDRLERSHRNLAERMLNGQ